MTDCLHSECTVACSGDLVSHESMMQDTKNKRLGPQGLGRDLLVLSRHQRAISIAGASHSCWRGQPRQRAFTGTLEPACFFSNSLVDHEIALSPLHSLAASVGLAAHVLVRVPQSCLQMQGGKSMVYHFQHQQRIADEQGICSSSML